MKKHIFLIGGLLVLIASPMLRAEIYRYQDANGKWQYTDRAPSDQVKSEVVKLKDNDESNAASGGAGDNLAEYLTKKINPGSDIEKASMAVVKIVTSYGSGSGFFISEKGYLITNKHVVRPDSSAQIENELKQAESNVKQGGAYLDDRSRELDRYKKQIDDYKTQIDNAPDAYKAKMLEEYNYHRRRYADMNAAYQQSREKYQAARDQVTAQRSAFGDSSVESSFKIILKDGTEKKARLVELGNNQDLALLKIDGNYVTPFLEAGQRV